MMRRQTPGAATEAWYASYLRNGTTARAFGLPTALAAIVIASAFAGGSACSDSGHAPPKAGHSGGGAGGSAGGSARDAAAGNDAGVAFEPVAPAVYVAKIKNVLVGLPPTDAEVTSVVADPTRLKGLIDGWMALPQYGEKMRTFFELAFQQTQIAITDLADQTYPRAAVVNASTRALLAQNVRESFARTVLALVEEGRPFTETITTRRFMMTPALMEFYAFLDAWQVGDDGKVTDRFKQDNPKLSITVEAAQGAIPIEQTLDPSSPNYMHWYDPDLASMPSTDPGCAEDPIVFPARGDALHFLIYGSLIGRKNAAGANCGQSGGSAAAPQLTAADFSSWKMVTIRPPNGGEAPTPFYDLAKLRSDSELVLTVPRVGFFTTPAFFANWQTNTSNQMRVTINQTLIVATGAAVDGTDMTVPSSTPGLDANHAALTDCLSCHQTLDPTRSILASTYSWNYHRQTDTQFASQKGLFVFQGVTKNVSSVGDLADVLANHPLFGRAWAQKLCYYVNSTECDPNDPELARVVGVFASAGYSWNALVRELLASPLTTGAEVTQTTRAGEVVAVSRRDHVCAALNQRLGFTDVCGLDAQLKVTQKTIPQIVAGLPSDGYGRGAVAPVLPNEPTLFYRAGMENICASVAAQVIDTAQKSMLPGVRQWSSQQPDAAISDFVSLIMGITPSDPRAAPLAAALNVHFSAAVKQGAKATDALRSTFIVACLSPSAVSIGL